MPSLSVSVSLFLLNILHFCVPSDMCIVYTFVLYCLYISGITEYNCKVSKKKVLVNFSYKHETLGELPSVDPTGCVFSIAISTAH